jgi:hypothetical protein
MKLFSFLIKKKTGKPAPISVPETVDKSKWTGKDFDFLITGNLRIPQDEYDNIMTPNSLDWNKVSIAKWSIYYVGPDTFCFFKDMHGIQMSFNETITYQKAKRITDEIIDNIKSTGQTADLIVLAKPDIYFSTTK